MTKQEIILANQRYLFPSVFHYFKEPLVIARAKDQFVWDADGNQYLDFFGGISLWGRRPRLLRVPWPGIDFTGRRRPANAPAAGRFSGARGRPHARPQADQEFLH